LARDCSTDTLIGSSIIDVAQPTIMSKEERLESESYEAITGTAEETTRGMRSKSVKRIETDSPSVVESEEKSAD
jgi:hypothetical protein